MPARIYPGVPTAGGGAAARSIVARSDRPTEPTPPNVDPPGTPPPKPAGPVVDQNRPTEPGPSLRGFLEAVEDLEVLPDAATRILTAADDPDATLADLERAVSLDPALSMQLLKLANSSFYGLRRSVATLDRAIFVVGFKATKMTALALSMLALGKSGKPGRRELWIHAMRTGAAAKRLAEAVEGFDDNEALVAGLLHDIGKLLILELDEKRYLKILEEPDLSPAQRLEAERKVLGFDHAELGATCLAQWGMPDQTVDAARRHHDDLAEGGAELRTEDQEPALLYLADHLAHDPSPQGVGALAGTVQAASVGADEGRLADVAGALDDDVSQLSDG